MPLIKSGSKKAFKTNVREMINSGYPQKQALAASYSNQRKYKASGGAVAAALSTARKYARKAEGGGRLETTGLAQIADNDPPQDPRMKAIGIRPVEGTPNAPEQPVQAPPEQGSWGPPVAEVNQGPDPNNEAFQAQQAREAASARLSKGVNQLSDRQPGKLTEGIERIGEGFVDQVATPGRLMSGPQQVEHKTPGFETEEEAFLQNLNNQAYDRQMTDFGAGMATNVLGISRFFKTPENAVGIGGAKLKTPALPESTVIARDLAHEVYKQANGDPLGIAQKLFEFENQYGVQHAQMIGEHLPEHVKFDVGDHMDALALQALNKDLKDEAAAGRAFEGPGPAKAPAETFGVPSSEFGMMGEAVPANNSAWDKFHEWHHKLEQEPINLTDNQKLGVGYWGSQGGYKDINEHLRGNHVGTAAAKVAIKNIDTAMKDHPLQEPASVWRGLYGPQAEALRGLKPGDIFFNKGYTATTVDPRQSTHYGAKDSMKYGKTEEDANILVNYHLPAGHPSLYVSHPEAGNYIQSERELLLPHGNNYKILGKEKIKAPVWHYLGNLVDPTPREFTVYHVEPTNEGHVKGMATQLDTGKSMPEPWQDKALKAIEESQAKISEEKALMDQYYADLEKQQNGPEWSPTMGQTGTPFSPLEDAIQQHAKWIDWKDYRPGKDADPVPASLKQYRDKIIKAGGNPDAILLKGGNHLDYPKQVMDPAKKMASNTKGFFMGDQAASSTRYGVSITPYVAVPHGKVIELNFRDLLTDAGYIKPGEDAAAYMPEFVEMIKHIRETYKPEMMIAHDVYDWADPVNKNATQFIVFNTNILRAPHAEFDPSKWHLRLPLAGIAGLPAGAGIYSYGNSDKGEDQKMARGGKVKFKPFSSIGELTGLDEGYRHKPYKKTVGAGKKALRTAKKLAEGGAAGDDYNTQLSPPNIQAPNQGPTSPNFVAARDTMNLNPQEQALYQRHLSNLYGAGGVDNTNGSRSTLYQSVEPHNGRFYNIPMVWDGKIQSQKWIDPNDSLRVFDVPNSQALQNIQKAGWESFPSYATAQQADDRYQQMHDYMEKDTTDYQRSQRRSGGSWWNGDEFTPPADKKRGGKVADSEPQEHEFINFAKGGMINSDIPGRTDKIPMKVATGAYVLPADIPSALGQGNTIAGKTILDKMFNSGPYGLPLAKGKSQKFQMPHLKGFAQGGRAAAEKALPANHQLGMKVPKGGSSCASCSFYKGNGVCGNKGFAQWHGSDKIPQAADQYCCDLYAHNTKKMADGGAADHTPIIAAGGEYVLNPDSVRAIGNGSMTAGHKILDAFTLHVRKEHIKTLRQLKPPK